MKNLLLFGAGASYGSDAETLTPPLGPDLYAALCEFHPETWGKVSDELAEVFHTDFEKGMQALSPVDTPMLQRVMAAYFFQFEPAPTNLYVDLATRIATNQWNGAICTLNYERLLELSLWMGGVNPCIGCPGSAQQLELIMPHGCCHLFVENGAIYNPNPAIATFNANIVQSTGPVVGILDSGEFHRRLEGNGLPPVMSFFEPMNFSALTDRIL